MGCCASSTSAGDKALTDSGAVKGELLLAELTGGVGDDDYLGKAALFLEQFQIHEPRVEDCVAANYFDVEHTYKLLAPGYLNLENGYLRAKNGIWFIATLTDLGSEVTGEMVDWWFRACENTTRFRWWHPLNHKAAEWDLPFYAKQLGEREPGAYVEHVQTVTMRLNGVDEVFALDFDRASKYFDPRQFAEANTTACICARVHKSDSLVGWVGIGQLIVQVRTIPGTTRSELRCRVWLGDINKIDDDSLCHPNFVNWMGNSYLFRLRAVTQSLAHAFWKHLTEEMACLSSFLPHYFETSVREGNVYERRPPGSARSQAGNVNAGGYNTNRNSYNSASSNNTGGSGGGGPARPTSLQRPESANVMSLDRGFDDRSAGGGGSTGYTYTGVSGSDEGGSIEAVRPAARPAATTATTTISGGMFSV